MQESFMISAAILSYSLSLYFLNIHLLDHSYRKQAAHYPAWQALEGEG